MSHTKNIYITVKCFVLTMTLAFGFGQFSFSQDLAVTNSSTEFHPFKMNLVGNLVPDEDELRGGLLYDVKRGTIVWQKDMDYAWPIASLTKMMVGLLAIQDVEAGKVCMDDIITVQSTYKKKVRRRRYKTYTTTERYLFSDLLKMAMIRSHNESTVWIAKHCSGSVESFIDRMNQMAESLGMTRTHYNNTSGLPAPGAMVDNSSSPRDLLLLALQCLKHPQLIEITAMPYVTVNNGVCNINYHNHNGLTINYTGEVDGIKTGYTRAAGFCMVATSGRADHRLISITLGARSPWIRNGIVAGMMNGYYDAIRMGRLGEAPPDLTASRLFLDSLSHGLVAISPRTEMKHNDTSDVSFAYTYKTEVQRIRKSIIVRSGDNISQIANRMSCSVAEIKKWNKLRSNYLKKGQQLVAWTTIKKRIPIKLDINPDEDVAENDSCADQSIIAEQKGTNKSVITLGTKENGKVTDTAKVAVVKKRQENAEIENTSYPKIIFHKVQPGDTLWNIAQRYRSTIQEIKRANRINGNSIKTGTNLKIPVVS